jgi:hypothetical protein
MDNVQNRDSYRNIIAIQVAYRYALFLIWTTPAADARQRLENKAWIYEILKSFFAPIFL